MHRSRIVALAFLCLSLCLPAFADRSLRWSEISVEAQLDARGAMNVVERQTIVFDGDWNGGERRFALRPGQKVRIDLFEELDAKGNRIPFAQGSLENTQTWAWHDETTLRWRARAASDPAFENESRTYVLSYTLFNTLLRRGTSYRLSHDFAFADRPGVIERLMVDFKLDPAWRPLAEYEMPVTRTDLQPGSSYVLTLPLEYHGSEKPMAIDLDQPVALPHAEDPRGAPALVRKSAGVIFLLVLAWLVGRFYLRERSRGRFARLESPSVIDRNWLQDHVLSRRPEVVGAAWDEKTGGAEVAAMLARLEAEGKIATRVEHKKNLFFERDVMHLTRKCEISTLPDYERNLLEALFVGRDETDTDHIRQVYKRHGFDPVAVIDVNLQHSLPWKDKDPSSGKWKWLGLTIAGYVAGVILSIIFLPVENTVTLIGWGFALAVTWPFVVWAGYYTRSSIAAVRRAFLMWLLPAGFMLFLIFVNAFFAASNLHWFALLLLGGLTLSLMHVLLETASTEGRETRIAIRRKLLAARRYFEKELRKPEPKLEDSWFPYVLAFGLGANVDRWFKSFGAASGDRIRSDSLSSSRVMSSGVTSSGFSAAPAWTGGGGSFGGAGASGSWSSAATALASSIAAPSSSSSGSGYSSGSSSSSSSSSSSGGSSGGGGGGGW